MIGSFLFIRWRLALKCRPVVIQGNFSSAVVDNGIDTSIAFDVLETERDRQTCLILR